MTTSSRAYAEKSTTVRPFISWKGGSGRALAWGAVRLAFTTACRLAPGLMARWFDRRFLTPRRFARPAWERGVLDDGAAAFSFTSGGRRLAAWRWPAVDGDADRPVALLVHGWEGRGAQLGAFVAPLREAGFQVVTFDAPGHGDSQGRQSSMVEMAAALRDLERELGPIDTVVAHSAGAAVSIYALRTGFVADRLVAISPPVDLTELTRRLGRSIGLTQDVLGRMQHRIEERLGVRWEELRSLPAAPTMTTPLAVVHDRGDRDVPYSGGAALAAAWPGASLKTTRGLGHRRILRDPEVIAWAMDFVRQGAEAEAC